MNRPGTKCQQSCDFLNSDICSTYFGLYIKRPGVSFLSVQDEKIISLYQSLNMFVIKMFMKRLNIFKIFINIVIFNFSCK